MCTKILKYALALGYLYLETLCKADKRNSPIITKQIILCIIAYTVPKKQTLHIHKCTSSVKHWIVSRLPNLLKVRSRRCLLVGDTQNSLERTHPSSCVTDTRLSATAPGSVPQLFASLGTCSKKEEKTARKYAQGKCSFK